MFTAAMEEVLTLPLENLLDIHTLIRSEHTIDSYGPDPKVGDTVEVLAWYGKKEIQIDGECRTAYDAYKIDTYDHILEMGDEPYFPLGP